MTKPIEKRDPPKRRVNAHGPKFVDPPKAVTSVNEGALPGMSGMVVRTYC